MKKLLVICGATATGKTSLAVECANALNSEVVSADSQLVYKGLNLGTAKPTFKEMRGIKHHLIDVVEPTSEFSVSDYERLATPIIEKLLADGKIPVICGGTGFYINSLLFDLSYGNTPANQAIREKYNRLLEEKGKEYLFAILKDVDNATAEKLHINDSKRVIRALEIYELSGRKKSEISDEFLPKYKYTAIALDFPREVLYNRINSRVDEMFERGLVSEVRKLLESGIDEKCQSMQAIGYKEVAFCLKNGDSQSTMRDIIKQNTRHYAKRQITFFKKLPNIKWLLPEDATVQKILELLNEG